jgi:hypothetical protein
LSQNSGLVPNQWPSRKAVLAVTPALAVDDRRWIDVKRDLYRSHPHCAAVLVIAQDRMEVVLDLRTEAGWTSSVLQGGEAELVISAFGFRCVVADLYARTPLQWRR